ncbi:MAG: porin [Planctomycetota bacterium]|nr:porin [Planctomycetota bacterium]
MTGEHRRYKKGGGVFDRVKPKRNFWAGNDEIGLGAWELALRYTWIDLDSDGPDDNGGTETSRIRGGKLQNITAAANWYLNPNAKVMFNYVFTDVEDGDRNTTVVDGVEGPNRANGQAHTFMMRFAMDF